MGDIGSDAEGGTTAADDDGATESAYGPLVETTLSVLTWNLWWRFGPWERREPAILETVRRLDPDVIGLQEVWSTDDGDSLAARIAKDLGYHHAHVSDLDLDGVGFGVAVLSRWPITGHDHIPLPAPEDRQERRVALRADIEGPRGSLQVFSTHLNWRFDESDVRQDQVRALAGFVKSSPPRSFPAVVVGDFNADPDSDEIRMLVGKSTTAADKLVFHDAWEFSGDGGPGFTWSNANPYARQDLERDRRIDYVFVGWPKANGVGHVVGARVVGDEPVGGVWPSDHLGVLAELRY